MENEILLRALAADILADLAKALKKFGEYSFDDKGADEVMQTSGYTTKLAALPADQAGLVLKLVGEGREDGRGETLRNFLAGSLDAKDVPGAVSDEWFEVMLKTSGAEY
jgi:hypothetical protein